MRQTSKAREKNKRMKDRQGTMEGKKKKENL